MTTLSVCKTPFRLDMRKPLLKRSAKSISPGPVPVLSNFFLSLRRRPVNVAECTLRNYESCVVYLVLHLSDWVDDPLKLSVVPGRIFDRLRRPYSLATVTVPPPLTTAARKKEV